MKVSCDQLHMLMGTQVFLHGYNYANHKLSIFMLCMRKNVGAW